MGKLYIVSTPIGNLDDITLRAIKILSSVDIVLCEDTRHTGLLLHHLNIDAKLMPYYDEIEEKKLPEVIGILDFASSGNVSREISLSKVFRGRRLQWLH
jgi:16S rRNA (cytidine1402-2'-O)-methyltransferase